MRKSSVFLIVLVLVLLDQALKFWIKTNMMIGEEFPLLTERIRIHFTENPGMAFGFELGGQAGKFALSIFRLVAIGVIIYLIQVLRKNNYPKGLIVCGAMILAGAIGNMIDSAFYGLLFTESTRYAVAELSPGNGYTGFLQGKVVDMFYCPLIRSQWPDWVPFWGNTSFVFFRPVFNIADSSITVGVLIVLFFQRRLLQNPGTADEATAGGDAVDPVSREAQLQDVEMPIDRTAPAPDAPVPPPGNSEF